MPQLVDMHELNVVDFASKRLHQTRSMRDPGMRQQVCLEESDIGSGDGLALARE
jgi:hypothetical protein